MAISYTISKHAISFPVKTLCAEGGNHIYNIVLSSDTDNGNFVGKGAYLGLDKYAEAAATKFVGKVRQKLSNGRWLVEVVDPGDALYVHNPVVIEEEWNNKFKAEGNWVNLTGEVVRGYQLAPGDTFELSDLGFTAAPVLVAGSDYYVELSGKKLAHPTDDPVVGAVAGKIAAAPTTSTKGLLGQMIFDGSYLYVCTDITAGAYTWKKAALA